MTLRIKQMLDTDIEISSQQAFALVSFRFKDEVGEEVIVSLDMEAAINVLSLMDNGATATKSLRKWYDIRRWIK